MRGRNTVPVAPGLRLLIKYYRRRVVRCLASFGASSLEFLFRLD